MRVTAKGQVTIPVELRERFGFLPDTEVDFVVEGGAVRLVRAERAGRSRGERAVALLRGRARAGMTTDEILALTREP
ncbi:AbrB/MazE/SpoVT family DNA-binding domain-containing protein [Pseudofrankia sp. DC12]|uniref:AbrB/MazE/SpoVT family DNA-binding domain-containing protein n=1 Tax=Pseudofrankia sp. DC12 TaxID=683315 RepID=UPI0005F86DE1